MGPPDANVSIAPDQVADVLKKLSVMRHNVNNHLALVVAAGELMRRKPELAARLIGNILEQPERINKEIRAFAESLEGMIHPGTPAASSR